MSSNSPDTSKASKIQADATAEAARINAASAKEGVATQERMFTQQQQYLQQQDEYNKGITVQNQANYQPYIDQGRTGLSMLSREVTDPNSMLNNKFDQGDMTADSGYQFRLAQGQNSLNQSLAAQGGLLSGAALKATSQFNQGLASDEYNAAYQRFTNDKNNRYTQLSNMANMGLAGSSGFAGGSAMTNTGSQMANIAGQFGNSITSINQNAADTNANLQLANANQQAQYALGTGGMSQGGKALGGAATGAIIGSQIMPGWGTAIGAVAGGLASLL
jgi:hypothetical protein